MDIVSSELRYRETQNKFDDLQLSMRKAERQLARKFAISVPAQVVHDVLAFHPKVHTVVWLWHSTGMLCSTSSAPA